MSERSSISLAEVLGDNYYIDKLTSSEYSPAVGDTVTITLLVNDVFGDPANGQTRTVTCTGGSFVSVNGSSITASDSVEVTTGSGGTVTLGLSVSVADTIIVSDGRCDCVVCSLSNSITNLVQIQYIEIATTSNANANGGTATATVTVDPLPSGYRYLIFERKGANGRLFHDILNGSTLTLTGQNLKTTADKVHMRVYLIYVPKSWSYVERISH